MSAITALPTPPSTSSPSTFAALADAFIAALPTFVTETNILAASMESIASGTVASIPYNFSTTTTDADPGAGYLRLDNATQNTATTIRADLLGSDGVAWTDVLALLDDSTSTVKGFIMLQELGTGTNWLMFSVSALASPSGYKNITVACVASSAASPFANGDSILLKFSRTGDKGDQGLQGDPGTDGAVAIQIASAGGTVDAITATYSTPLTLTDKVRCMVVSSGANTSTTPSFAPDGLTTRTITTYGGEALWIGATGAAGCVLILEYNLSNTRWELLNPVPYATATRLAGGYTATSSAVDITLTSSSNQLQYVNMSVAGKSVILPDARTLKNGDTSFTLQCKGLGFSIRESGTQNIIHNITASAVVGTATSVSASLVDNSTQAGIWSFHTRTPAAVPHALPALVENVIGTTASSTTELDPGSKYLTVYAGSSKVNAVVWTMSGEIATVGTPVQFAAGNNPSGGLWVTALSTTKAIAAYIQPNSGYAVTIDVSGTVPTFGTQMTMAAAQSSGSTQVLDGGLCINAMSSTAVVFLNRDGVDTGTMNARLLTASGSTVSEGAAAVKSLGAATVDYNGCHLDSGKHICVGSVSGTNHIYCLTVSGTTCTWQSGITQADAIDSPSIRKATTTGAIYVSGSTTKNVRYVSCAATTPSITSSLAFAISASGKASVALLSSTLGLMFTSVSSKLVVSRFAISGTSLAFVSPFDGTGYSILSTNYSLGNGDAFAIDATHAYVGYSANYAMKVYLGATV